MQSHGPKRFYTPRSLEFWFQQLTGDWSESFTANQLEEGRRIYRAGEVRELELSDQDAIVHRRMDKKDEYAVIEWSARGLSVRSSSTDRELANALAVAGLHEIEELVADEIPPLPGEEWEETATEISENGELTGLAPAESSGAPGSPANPSGQGLEQQTSFGNGGVRPNGGPSRPLLLVFRTKAAGLSFHAVWVDPDRKTRLPAL